MAKAPTPDRCAGRAASELRADAEVRGRPATLAWPAAWRRFRPEGSALAVPEFRRFWIALIVSNIGSWMQLVAQGWLILELTNSPFYLGLFGLLRSIPALTITLVGGVVADRFDRRRILLLTQVSAAALALLLGVLDLAGLVRIWHVLAIAFLSATVMAFDNPARQSLVPSLVGRERIASAVGLNSAAWNSAAVVGPSLAGLLVAAAGTGGAFVLNGLSYFPVIWAVWTIQPAQAQPRPRTGLAQNLIAGLRFIRSDRRIWGLLTMLAVPTLLGRPYLQLMPVFARNVLHADASGYGLLMGTNGLGALLGALAVGATGSRHGKGKRLLLVSAAFGVTLVAFSLSHWFLISAALLLLVGASQTMMMGLTNTLLQLNVPEEVRGRVMSVYTLIPMGFMPLGTMLLGSLGEYFGVPLVVGVAALLVVAFAALAYQAFPDVRGLP
ncbi:MFS transporter [Thermomicrobiaceae bacterium CFH 74404]|uniref:MFS transporter n=1 Tax=Thermalbibacter longus TaxID=2951981 RepID=A0AA41WF87_9BACT|nr:MFS transporter [Thermalbibacter longus]MCM8749305.1 MFS transporter [Thermalbibacter longus]